MSGYYRSLLALSTPSGGGATYSYSTQLQAIIDRANTEGFYVPPNSILEKVDDFIIQMVLAGRWGGQYLFNFAYNDLNCKNFSRINWLNPSGPLATLVNSPTYGAYGFKGNGTNAYINTGYIPGNDGDTTFRRNVTKYFIYSEATSTNKHIDGNSAGNNVMFNQDTDLHKNYNRYSFGGEDMTGVGFMYYTLTSYVPPKAGTTSVMFFHKNGTTYNGAPAGILNVPTTNQWLFRNTSNYSNVGICYYHHINSKTLYGIQTRAEYNTYLNGIGLASI